MIYNWSPNVTGLMLWAVPAAKLEGMTDEVLLEFTPCSTAIICSQAAVVIFAFKKARD